jgi:hypothetical protein
VTLAFHALPPVIRSTVVDEVLVPKSLADATDPVRFTPLGTGRRGVSVAGWTCGVGGHRRSAAHNIGYTRRIASAVNDRIGIERAPPELGCWFVAVPYT